MAIDRRFLYAGLFLVAIGGVLVVADLSGVDRGLIRQALSLWPLAVIALGVGILLRRTSLSLPAGVAAAIAPGLLLGGSFAVGPPRATDCGSAAAPAPVLVSEGTATSLDHVRIATGCGASTIATADGTAWRVSSGRSDGRGPTVIFEGGLLDIESEGRGRQLILDQTTEALDVVLPTAPIELLGITANANRMDVSLWNAELGSLVLDVNASEVRVNGLGGRAEALTAEVNFGSLTLVPPVGRNLEGRIEVNAGGLTLCQPLGSTLRVTFRGDVLGDVSIEGADRTFHEGDVWQSDREILASNHLDLTIEANLASIAINPIGDCK